MSMITRLATKLLAALSVVGLMASPMQAQDASDMSFAFGAKAAAPAGQQIELASARGMTATEMRTTEGAVLPIVVALGARVVITQAAKHGVKLLGPGPGGRICGVVCKDKNFGARIDFADNPSPTKLHLHIGTLDKARSSQGVKNNSWNWHRPINNPWKKF